MELKCVFSCVRCCRQVTNEEKYLIFRSCYCRACINTIENSRDYIHVTMIQCVMGKFGDQIEN